MEGLEVPSEVAGVVVKWGVGGVKENGEYLVDICAERRLLLANTFSASTDTHGGGQTRGANRKV